MTTSTATIADFLLARIDEDEAVARAGVSGQADPENGWGYGGFGSPNALTPHVGIIHERVQADHITRWHPARVLAECAAKRAIVESWREADKMYGGDAGAYMDGVLRALASVYDDHPDYDPAWS